MNICHCISVRRQVFPEIYLLKFMLHQRKLVILTMNSFLKGSYGERFGKTQSVLTGNGIWLLPGRRDSPKFVHGMRVFFACLSRKATANQPSESSVVSSSYSSKPCLFSSNITLSSWSWIELGRLKTEFSGRSPRQTSHSNDLKNASNSTFLVFLASKTQVPSGSIL